MSPSVQTWSLSPCLCTQTVHADAHRHIFFATFGLHPIMPAMLHDALALISKELSSSLMLAISMFFVSLLVAPKMSSQFSWNARNCCHCFINLWEFRCPPRLSSELLGRSAIAPTNPKNIWMIRHVVQRCLASFVIASEMSLEFLGFYVITPEMPSELLGCSAIALDVSQGIAP